LGVEAEQPQKSCQEKIGTCHPKSLKKRVKVVGKRLGLATPNLEKIGTLPPQIFKKRVKVCQEKDWDLIHPKERSKQVRKKS